MTEFVLPQEDRDNAIERVSRFLASVLPGKRVKVEVTLYRKRRSDQQNRYLWGVCYPTILREGVEELGGWKASDLHEYFLGEWSGWETLEGFGMKRRHPIQRSHSLTTVEFQDFVASIQQTCAEHGWYVPDPNEVEA